MKHIVEKYDQNIYQSSILEFYFGGMNVGVLDIETTGLDSRRNKFILGGLFNCQTHEMHQILAESRGEEAEALGEYLDELSKLDLVVTYNGRHFDLPFLKQRLEVLTAAGKYTRADDRKILQKLYDLDLFILVQGHSPIKKLVPNLKQKTLENYMGFWDTRADEISGAESVELYNHYEKTKDPEAERKILLHNNDDVRQLTKLTKVISKCDLHKGMYSMGYPASGLMVEKPSLRSDRLDIRGSQAWGDGKNIDYCGFELDGFPVRTVFSTIDNSFEFEIPLIRNAGLTVIDLEAAGLCTDELRRLPNCESGFLVIADQNGINHMEINYFTKLFIDHFLEEAL